MINITINMNIDDYQYSINVQNIDDSESNEFHGLIDSCPLSIDFLTIHNIIPNIIDMA